MIAAADAVPIISVILDNVPAKDKPYSKYSLSNIFGKRAVLAGPRNASAVEIVKVVIINIHGCKIPIKYNVATHATQNARIRSVITIIVFFFFPSTQAPARGVITTDGK